MKHVILFTGFPGSGKSTALKVTDQFHDVETYEMSDFVRELYNSENNGDVNDNDLGRWANNVKEEQGDGFFAEVLASNIEESIPQNKSVAISGIRSPDEVSAFCGSSPFSSVTVIAILANNDVLWERISVREDMDRETFDERIDRESRWGVNEVIQYADIWLRNENTTLKRFEVKVENIVKGILEEEP